MRDYSATSRRGMNATSGETAVLLLEITHPDLAVPIRVAQDNQDVVCQGDTFVAFEFDFDFPPDMDKQAHRGTLRVGNIGRELTQWLEVSNGGEGAQARVIHVQRADPDVIEWECTMELANVETDYRLVTGDLGFEDLLNAPAVVTTYRPDTAPGIF